MVDELRFDGRVAIVTGAGREQGMGEAHAKFLAERGAKVVVNDFAADGSSPAQRVVDEINAAGGTAVANGDTVATAGGTEAMVATALEHFGRVDIVINNAGIATLAGFPEENDLVDFTRNFDVHLAGAFNLCRAAWPHFVSNDYGRIVNITSSALLGITFHVSYPAMKAGMIGLTRCLALLGDEHNIKANAVAPAAKTLMGPHNVTALPNGEEIPLDPRLVSTGVAVLVHESCPTTGEVFGVGGGKVDRIFLGCTQGYVDADLTPESLLAHWDKVMDLENFWIPEHCREHSDRLRQDRASLLAAL